MHGFRLFFLFLAWHFETTIALRKRERNILVPFPSMYALWFSSLLHGESIVIDELEIPLFLIGDSAYPLSTFLMKPFPHNSIVTPAQKKFNYNLSKARIVVENAFGRLKARWRRLTKRNDMDVCNVPRIVTACCILHNICEIHGDELNGLKNILKVWNNHQQQLPQITLLMQ